MIMNKESTMTDELTTILNACSKEELIEYLKELASQDRGLMMEIMQRFKKPGTVPSLEFLEHIIIEQENSYDIFNRFPSPKASASFSMNMVNRINEITGILMEADEKEKTRNFLLWMSQEANLYNLDYFDRSLKDPISDIACCIQDSFGYLSSRLLPAEKEDLADRVFEFIILNDADYSLILYQMLALVVFDNTSNERLLKRLMRVLHVLARSYDKADIFDSGLCQNSTIQYKVLKKLGLTPSEILQNMEAELQSDRVKNNIADKFMEEEKWEDAYNLYLRGYYNESTGKYSIVSENKLYAAAYNSNHREDLAPYLVGRMKESPYYHENDFEKLQNLIGIDKAYKLLPEILENKEIGLKLEIFDEYDMTNELADTLLKEGLLDDLVAYHEKMESLGHEKLEEMYWVIVDRTVDIKKSRDNYYAVFGNLRYNLPLTHGKNNELKNRIMDYLAAKYPNRRALLEIIEEHKEIDEWEYEEDF